MSNVKKTHKAFLADIFKYSLALQDQLKLVVLFLTQLKMSNRKGNILDVCALQFSINLCRLRLFTLIHTDTHAYTCTCTYSLSLGSPVHCFKKCYLGRKALRIGKRRAISEEHTPLARLQQLSVAHSVCVGVCVRVFGCLWFCVSVRQSGDSVSALSCLKTHVRTGQRDSQAGRQDSQHMAAGQ